MEIKRRSGIATLSVWRDNCCNSGLAVSELCVVDA